ncbi:maltose permease [Mycena sanguinolenta]|nr:maltose permease [Mycena sanguinolenta]
MTENPGSVQDAVLGTDNSRLAREIDNYTEIIHDAAQADQVNARSVPRPQESRILEMVLSAALIMEGYDVVVIAAFYEQPAFLKRFGVVNPATGERVISAPWQSGLGNGSSARGIIGLMINGWASERFRPRRTYIVSMLGMIITIFGLVFSQTLAQLTASEIICGLFWGVLQTLTTAYASEVCAIALRHYLTAYINMCWGIGILLSSGVVRASLAINSDWGWRLPFVIQWVWPIPPIFGAYFAPESPWWLVRLTDPNLFSKEDTKRSVANMIHTTALEREMQAGTSYVQCFSGIDLWRTEIAIIVASGCIQTPVYNLKQAGLGTVPTFNVSLALNSGRNAVSSCAFWTPNTLHLGSGIMATVLLIIGTRGFSPSNGAQWAVGGLLVLLSFVYNATLGAVCYVIIAEVGSTRLRAKTIVLARCTYQAMNIICGVIVLLMLSPTSWNWGPKSGFFWFGTAALSALYCWFRLPEREVKIRLRGRFSDRFWNRF